MVNAISGLFTVIVETQRYKLYKRLIALQTFGIHKGSQVGGVLAQDGLDDAGEVCAGGRKSIYERIVGRRGAWSDCHQRQEHE